MSVIQSVMSEKISRPDFSKSYSIVMSAAGKRGLAKSLFLYLTSISRTKLNKIPFAL